MKERAQQNESVIEKRMWNIDLNQICVPILHVILGITKKLFDIMITALQNKDDTCAEQTDFKHVIDILNFYVSSREEWKKKVDTRLKMVEKDYDDAKNDYSDAMLLNVSNDYGLLVREKHNIFVRVTSELKSVKEETKMI